MVTNNTLAAVQPTTQVFKPQQKTSLVEYELDAININNRLLEFSRQLSMPHTLTYNQFVAKQGKLLTHTVDYLNSRLLAIFNKLGQTNIKLLKHLPDWFVLRDDEPLYSSGDLLCALYTAKNIVIALNKMLADNSNENELIITQTQNILNSLYKVLLQSSELILYPSSFSRYSFQTSNLFTFSFPWNKKSELLPDSSSPLTDEISSDDDSSLLSSNSSDSDSLKTQIDNDKLRKGTCNIL